MSRSLTFILFLAALSANAQTPAARVPAVPATKTEQVPSPVAKEEEIGEGEVLRINATLVTVPVTVINRQGQYVVDLQQKDFRLFEDGVEQTIAHFSNIDRPFSVALLIDTSGSAAPFLEQIKGAAKVFVEQLRPSDRIRPIYFHGEIKSLTKAGTNDPQVLSASIDLMQPGPSLMGTRLYDAVDYALGVLKPGSARKAIILFTDGENTWGRSTLKSTLTEAQESDVIIYTLQYGDDPPNKYLQQLADKTGGRYFKTGDIHLIRQSFAGVADELRRQYMIGYYPNASERKERERTIKVRVNRDRVAVRARKSYVRN